MEAFGALLIFTITHGVFWFTFCLLLVSCTHPIHGLLHKVTYRQVLLTTLVLLILDILIRGSYPWLFFLLTIAVTLIVFVRAMQRQFNLSVLHKVDSIIAITVIYVLLGIWLSLPLWVSV